VFVVQTIGSGLIFYNLSVLLSAFIAERGFPVAQTSFATGSFFIASGTAGMLAGRLMDRSDPRYVIGAGACLAALTLSLAGVVKELWQLYLFYMVLGFAYGTCGLVPGATLVTRWFHARRALAISVASTGLSVGGVLITPAVARLIAASGLAGAAPWMGAVVFLGMVPAAVLLMRRSPASMGLLPDGAEPAKSGGPSGAPAYASVSFSEARRSPFFIGLTIAYVFALGAQVGGIAHIFRLAGERSDARTAGLAVAMVATASFCGRIAGGWLLVRAVSARAFTLAIIALQGVSLAFLSAASSPFTLIAGAGLFGLAVGNVLMMQPLLLAEAFGTKDYGRIYSTSQFIGVLGLAGGPALLGFLYEAGGGYTGAYLTAAACSLVGFSILFLSGSRVDSSIPTRRG
jgi:MFS family permease